MITTKGREEICKTIATRIRDNENGLRRLRRLATRHGLTLVKSRKKGHRDFPYNVYEGKQWRANCCDDLKHLEIVINDVIEYSTKRQSEMTIIDILLQALTAIALDEEETAPVEVLAVIEAARNASERASEVTRVEVPHETLVHGD